MNEFVALQLETNLVSFSNFKVFFSAPTPRMRFQVNTKLEVLKLIGFVLENEKRVFGRQMNELLSVQIRPFFLRFYKAQYKTFKISFESYF